MPTLKIFAMRDNKTAIYHKPFYVRHEQEALRQLETAVNDEKRGNEIAAYPKEFDLYEFGDFNDDGYFNLLDLPRFVLNAHSLYRGEQK